MVLCMKKEKFKLLIIILIVSLISILPLIFKSNIYGHDSHFHLANIIDLTNSMSFKNIFPKISSEIGYGLGYGTHLFYPPLPHFISSLFNIFFRLLGLGSDNCLVFIYLLCSFFSGLVIYYLALEIFNDKKISLLSSIIYVLMPYRMGDMIVRCSLNEVFIFIFFPMILLSLIRMKNNKNFSFLFIIGYVGLILSHFVLAFYASFLFIIWAIIFYKDIFKKEIICNLIKNIIIVTIIVLPFLILLLSQKNGITYMVFLDNYITEFSWMKYYSLSITDFIIPLSDYSWDVPQFINIFVLISTVYSLYTIVKKKINNKLYYFMIGVLILNLAICLNIFPWKILPDIFYMIQFPWRCQTFISLFISLICPIWIIYSKNKKNICIIFSILLIVSSIPFIKNMMSYKYLITGDIDLNKGMGNMNEYLPINLVNKNTYEISEYALNRNNGIKCEYCLSNIIKNQNDILEFNISTNIVDKIELPRIYYTGYVLRDEDGKKIDFYANSNHLIEFVCENENKNYVLNFEGTLLYKISIYVRNISIILIIVNEIYKINKQKKKSSI